jgi:urea ABC transporter urea binding protein
MEASVRVGLLHSLSGTMARSERPLLDVERFAIGQINAGGGVLGRPIEPLVADGASDPALFAQQAGHLLARGAVALFGCWTSSSRKAVKRVVEASASLLFYPVQYEGLEESPHLVYTGSCLNQQISPAVAWARQQLGRRAFLLGSDYVFPRVALRLARALLDRNGGEVVGDHYLPLGEMDCAAVVGEIRRTRPDFVINTLNGESNVAFFCRLGAAGVSAAEVPVLSMSAAESEMEPVAAISAGHFACWSYFQSLDTEENRRFVQAFQKHAGGQPLCTASMVSAYAQLFLWRQAVEASGSPAPADVRRRLPGTQVLAPAGPMVVLENHHTPLRAFIGKLQPDGQFAIVWASPEPIAPMPWLGVESSGLPCRGVIQEAMASYPDTVFGSAESLRVSEERLRLAVETTGLGMWEWYPLTGESWWDQKARELFWLSPKGPISASAAVQQIHPDDRARVNETIQRALDPAGAGRYSMEFRVCGPAGKRRWVQSSGQVCHDGAVGVRVVQTALDITERKEAEERFRLFAGAAFEGISIVEGTRIVLANEQLASMLHCRVEELVGHEVTDFVSPGEHARVRARIAENDTTPTELLLRRTDGSTLTVELRSRNLDRPGRLPWRLSALRDVTERKATEEALREADRRKTEFLAVLSHELRNPLAPIRTSLFVLERAPPGGEKARDALAVIDRQVTHLARLIDDLLDMTRITRGKLQLQRAHVELGALVHQSLDDFRSGFEAKRVLLEGRLNPEPVWIDADPTRIAQVIGNLLRNASMFTQRGGRVEVSLQREGAQAVLRVRDTGQGIAPEDLRQLFQPFFQAAQTLARTAGGLGLGLSLVKALVELHGGSVSVVSEGLGRGSEFTVRLPLAAPVQQAAAAEEPHAARPHRVLVIDDNVDAANTLKEILEIMGHEVRVAYDGLGGIAAARAFHPEMVLCDIGLPGIDGYEVARVLRADESLRGTTLVAVSGYALPADKQRAVEAGFSFHLTKPSSMESLERVLEAAD